MAGLFGKAGGPCLRGSRPCWCWPTCARTRPFHALAAGFGIGVATVHRYIHEALGVLAVRAPTLAQAVAKAARKAYTRATAKSGERRVGIVM